MAASESDNRKDQRLAWLPVIRYGVGDSDFIVGVDLLRWQPIALNCLIRPVSCVQVSFVEYHIFVYHSNEASVPKRSRDLRLSKHEPDQRSVSDGPADAHRTHSLLLDGELDEHRLKPRSDKIGGSVRTFGWPVQGNSKIQSKEEVRGTSHYWASPLGEPQAMGKFSQIPGCREASSL